MGATGRPRKRSRCLLWRNDDLRACMGWRSATLDRRAIPRPEARRRRHEIGPSMAVRRADDHYSPLAQINRGNVGKLAVAWTYDTGEKGVGLQTSPLIVGRTLYAYTPTQKVIALDAATGKLLWSFDSGVAGTQPVRGLTWWSNGDENGAGSRLFAGIANFLYALNPRDGKPITSFGENGRIDLRKNLRGDYREQSIALTTPGIVYKDLIIVGGRNPETHPAPPGDIRAFDVHSGALRWSFHTIPHPGEDGYETWPKDAWLHSGAANNWTGMALDEKRGILYAPTGSAVSDFYGADRSGQDLFRRHFACSRRIDRQTRLVIPGSASRHLGSGFSFSAITAHCDESWQTHRRSRTGHKAGLSLSLRSRQRAAALSHHGAGGAREQCAGREKLAHATPPALACAVCTAIPDQRHADESHARSTRICRREIPQLPERRPVRSVERGQADHRLPRLRWRRGMGRFRRGYPKRGDLHQRERNGLDRRPDRE